MWFNFKFKRFLGRIQKLVFKCLILETQNSFNVFSNSKFALISLIINQNGQKCTKAKFTEEAWWNLMNEFDFFFAKSKNHFKCLDNFLLLLTHISLIGYLFVIFQMENSVWRIKSLVSESIGVLTLIWVGQNSFKFGLWNVWCLNTALAAVNYISCKQL